MGKGAGWGRYFLEEMVWGVADEFKLSRVELSSVQVQNLMLTSLPRDQEATMALHANGMERAPMQCLPCSRASSSSSECEPWHSCSVMCCK